MIEMLTPIKKKNSRLCGGEDGSFPKTPSPKYDQRNTPSLSNKDAARQTPTPTLRERRSRRDTASSLYRPLSVFTRSVLMPFDFDTDRAFETIKSGETTPAPTSRRRPLTSVGEQRAIPRRTTEFENTTPSRASKNVVAFEQLPFRTESAMDLLTALKTTSPDRDSSSHLTAKYAMLTEIPVPNLKEHPMFNSSPFTSTSHPPMLFTTSSPEVIRKFHSRKSKSSDKTDKSGESDAECSNIERKKSFFNLGIKTPTSTSSKREMKHENKSPSTHRHPPRTNNEARGSVEATLSSASSSDGNRKSASSGSSRGGIRKFSDFFKPKVSMEKQEVLPALPMLYSDVESPNLDRQDLEYFLRRTTFSPTYDFDEIDGYPRHPNTGRGWRSRNLKCTTCCEDSCASCQRCCCAYKAAVSALETHKEGSVSRRDALLRIQEITKLFPYGKEAPTFLQCTLGFGDNGGCGKMVCPDCCSICPDDACRDTQCKVCKPLMWEECDWHKRQTSTIQFYHPIGLGLRV